MKQKTLNIDGVIRFTLGYNCSGLKCFWVDSFDSYAGIHSKKAYRTFRRKLLKALKQLDKEQKDLGKSWDS